MRNLLFILLVFFLFSCEKENSEPEVNPEKLGVTYIYIGETSLTTGNNENAVIDEPVEIRFDKPVNTISAQENIVLLDSENQIVNLEFQYFNQNRLIKIGHPVFDEGETYKLTLSGSLKGENNESFDEQVFSFTTLISPLKVESVFIDGNQFNPVSRIQNINRNPQVELHFNTTITSTDLISYSSFYSDNGGVDYSFTQIDEKTISFSTNEILEGFQKYQFNISSNIENKIGRPFEGFDLNFYTEADTTPKFPKITDEELLTLVQEQTFKYFWDNAHPVSGLAHERNTSAETVTSGGSGFGLMAIIVGIERGFITRTEGVERLNTIVDFLENADRFHGAWSHWLNGTTGEAKPFSQKDNGGDLVETSYMAAGLLAVRQYLNPFNATENNLIDKINTLWNAIEWDWYTKGENVLYWHWSPEYNWEMNMQIRGYNEALITYIMAASSETHTISADVYHEGWAKNGTIINGNDYYGIDLPLGYDYGGPLFFAHYSFLGINPQNLSDTYANYWTQNRNHSLINRAHCIENPNNFVGYSEYCWGLTASDNHQGYSAHSPTNDLGVITPTAAISSIPFTPEESMGAIRFFYYTLGDKLWGENGFYDAFNITEGWTANSYLAIDQGPIIIMIENYRTGLIWDLLMSSPEVQSGLTKLGFTY